MRSATLTHKRCSWASVDGPMLLQYHDLEWGVPVHNDRKHFEVLVLSGAQAGLNWSLVLKKREGYRRAFDKFDPEKVARYSEKRIQTLLSDEEIIRNRMKIEAAVQTHAHFSKFSKTLETLIPIVGALSTGGPSLTTGRIRGRFQRLRPSLRRSATTSRNEDLASSDRLSFMRTCRRLES